MKIQRIVTALAILLAVVSGAGTAWGADVAVNDVHVRSINPSRNYNIIFAPENGRIQANVVNLDNSNWANNVTVGFYDEGNQIGDTITVSIQPRGAQWVVTGFVWATAGLANTFRTITVQVGLAGDPDYNNNNTTREVYVFDGSTATGGITGRVRLKSGLAIPELMSVRVKCDESYYEMTTTFDAAGYYQAAGLVPGSYYVSFEPGDDSIYARAWRVGIGVNQDTVANVDMLSDTNPAASGAITVQVIDEFGNPINMTDYGQGNRPLELNVSYFDPNRNEEWSANIFLSFPADGRGVIRHLPPGDDYQVQVWEPHFGLLGTEYSTEKITEITVTGGETTTVGPLQTFRAGGVRGLITDKATGDPITGIDVTGVRLIGGRKDWDWEANTVSDDTDAFFEMRHLRPGVWMVGVEDGECPGYENRQDTNVVVQSGEFAIVPLQLEAGAEVYGTLPNIAEFIRLTNYYPGPGREMGIGVFSQLTPGEYSRMKSDLTDRFFEDRVLRAFTNQVDLNTGEFSFNYTFPPNGTFELAPLLYWENDNGGAALSTFGSQLQTSPGGGNDTSVTVALSTAMGRLTGTITPDTVPPEQVVIWVVPSSEARPLAAFANGYRDPVTGTVKYDIPYVATGTYNVYAALPGHDSITQTGIQILQGATKTVNVAFNADVTAPAAPTKPNTGAVTFDADENITVTWIESAAADVASYRVACDTGAGYGYVNVAVAPAGATTYVDAQAKSAGITYRYEVTAVDWAGNESDTAATWSLQYLAATTGLLLPADGSIVDSPASSDIWFQWNAIAGADSYLFFLLNSSMEYVVNGYALTATGGQYIGTALTTGETYYWGVQGRPANEAWIRWALRGDENPFTFVYAGPSHTGISRGHVVTVGGGPAAGIPVYLQSPVFNASGIFPFDVTDGTGYFEFTGLADEEYSLREEQSPKTLSLPFILTGGSTDSQTIQLKTAGAPITGTVTDLQGDPIGGALVIAGRPTFSRWGDFGVWLDDTRTNAAGSFTLTGLAAGDTYTISIGLTNTETWDTYAKFSQVNVAPGANLNIRLAPTALVSGLVTDAANGMPIVNLLLDFNSPEYEGYTRTDAYGHYSLGLIPGPYTIYAWADEMSGSTEYGNYKLLGQTVGLGNNRINLQLPRGGQIAGTADTGGYTFNGPVQVVAFPAGTVLTARDIIEDNTWPTSGANVVAGAFTISYLPTGSYDLYFVLDPQSPEASTDDSPETQAVTALKDPLTGIAVTAAQTTTGCSFTVFSAGNALAGDLVSGGSAITTGVGLRAGVALNSTSDGRLRAIATMANLGAGDPAAYRLEGIPSGTYTLVAYASGYDTYSATITIGGDSVYHVGFSTDVTPPDTPTWAATTPLWPAITEENNITLTWTPSNTAEWYEVWRQGPSDPGLVAVTTSARPEGGTAGDTVWYTDYTAVDTGWYQYCLKAVDLAGNVGDTSTTKHLWLLDKSFTTDTGAETIQPIIPDDGELNTASPSFRWNAVPGAATYNFYLKSNQGLLQTVANWGGTALDYFDTAPKLYPGRSYSWSVEAVGGADTVSRTPWRPFAISTNLTPPRIVHQRLYDAAVGMSVALDAEVFAPGGGVSSVQLQYGTGSGFTAVEMALDTTTSGHYSASIPGDFITDGMSGFYYRIVARGEGGAVQVPYGDPTVWDIEAAYSVPVSTLIHVSGCVYETGTAIPVEGAQIWGQSSDGPISVQNLTDAEGRFELALTMGDTYYLIAQAHGYQPLMPWVIADTMLEYYGPRYGVRVVLMPGETIPADGALILSLEDSPAMAGGLGWAAGFARDEQGNPLAGAIVIADNPQLPGYEPDLGLAVSDARGYFEIPNLSPDTPFSVLGQLTGPSGGAVIMQGWIGAPLDPFIPDSFTVVATQEKWVGDLMMSTAAADDSPPYVMALVDSGPQWVAYQVSEDLDPGVLDPDNYSVTDTALGASLGIGRVDYNADNRRITVYPRQSFANGMGYVFHPSGLADWAGNALLDYYDTFTIDYAGDAIDPTILGVSAVRGDSVGAEVAVYFSEAMDTLTATNPVNYSLTAGGTVLSGRIVEAAVVNLTVGPLVAGDSYTLTVTGVQDVSGNALVAVGVPFQGVSSGTSETISFIALSADEGHPRVEYGKRFIIVSRAGDVAATVVSSRDPVGITVSLVACDQARLPEIVYDPAGLVTAASVLVDSVSAVASSGDTSIAAAGGDPLTVTGLTSGLTAFLAVSDTIGKAGWITGTVSDTAQVIVTATGFADRVWSPNLQVVPPGTPFSVLVDERGTFQLSATRMSDYQTVTVYDLAVNYGDTKWIGTVTFAASADTYGVITGIIDRPDTGPALMTWESDGTPASWPLLTVHRSWRAERAGKPLDPRSDLIQLANGDLKYTLWGLPVSANDTATYIIFLTADGYTPVSQSVELTWQKKDRTNVNFVLATAGAGTIRGRVSNGLDIPLAGVPVTTVSGQYGSGAYRSAETNEGGFFEIRNLPAGSYAVNANGGEFGYLPKYVQVTLDTGATVAVSLQLMPALTIHGTVTADTPGGVTIEAVPLWIRTFGTVEGYTTVTAANGQFTLLGLPQSEGVNFRLTASKPGYASVTILGVEPGDTDVLLALTAATATITGQVVSSDTFIEGAVVRAVSQAQASQVLFAQSDASGTFTIAGVPAGYYNVEVVKEGYRRSVVQNVAAVSGRTTILPQLVLEDGASISGRVTIGNGAGLAGAVVLAMSADNNSYFGSATTNALGSYAIVGLVKNVYYKMVVIQNQGADVYPYSKLVFLTGDATVNIGIGDYGPQFVVDCRRSSLADTLFTLTISASEELSGPPLLAIDTSGAGYFVVNNVNDSKAVNLYGQIYFIGFIEPDTSATLERFVITGTDLQGNYGACTYTFQPLYQRHQEILVNACQDQQYSLGNGAGVQVPANSYDNVNDTAGDAARSSVRMRISQVDISQSVGETTSYYGAPAYRARYAPSAGNVGYWRRASADYDYTMTDGSGETVAVADGKYLTLTIPYDASFDTLAAQGKLHLYYFNETLGRWMGEATSQTVDLANRTVTVSVGHLSKFAAFKDPELVGDASGNGQVESQDLVVYNTAYSNYQSNPSGSYDATYDISGPDGIPDGVIDFYDTAELGDQYGSTQ